jgi:hypothetical protein
MTMKKLIAIIATAVTGLIVFPQEAEAGHAQVSITYRSGHSACGCPMYTKRYFSGYDCYRRPVYRYVGVPLVHRCRGHAGPPAHYRNHNYYNHSRHDRRAPRPVRGRGHGYGHGRPHGNPHGYRPGYR